MISTENLAKEAMQITKFGTCEQNFLRQKLLTLRRHVEVVDQ